MTNAHLPAHDMQWNNERNNEKCTQNEQNIHNYIKYWEYQIKNNNYSITRPNSETPHEQLCWNKFVVMHATWNYSWSSPDHYRWCRQMLCFGDVCLTYSAMWDVVHTLFVWLGLSRKHSDQSAAARLLPASAPATASSKHLTTLAITACTVISAVVGLQP